MNKSVHVTSYFWIIKICAATLGETAGDLMSMTINAGCPFSLIIFISFLFLSALIIQLLSNRFHPALYWPVFWLAFILTRPFGATFGGLLIKPIDKRWGGFGTAGFSMIFVTPLAAFVVYTIGKEKRMPLEAIA
jgi:uncharacterized membrane-anchored protein